MLESVGGANQTDVPPHQVTDVPSELGVGPVLTRPVAEMVVEPPHQRFGWRQPVDLAHQIAADPRAEHQRIEQGVTGQAVRSVHTDAADLAAGPQARQTRAPACVHGHTAHVIVRGG